MDTEDWRPVVDYEGRYEVSNHGRVRSLGFYCNNHHGTRTWRAGRVLDGFAVQPQGYRAVALADGSGKTRTAKVHRLVLRAFAGEPPPGKPNGLHKDDDPAHNHLGNLRWGSYGENTYDSIENGSHVQARKRYCQLDHLLVEPNLVPSTTTAGGRGCLACKLSQNNHTHDERLRAQGRQRTRYNRGRDGFQRCRGETWQEEAHRRYAHIMRDQLGGA